MFLVDFREGHRGVRACDGFRCEGFDSDVVPLEFGDYVVDDVVVFEYKTVPDFVGSLYNGSLFNEIFNQSEVFPFSFLVIEGDFSSYFYKVYFSSGKSHLNNGGVKKYIDSQMEMVRGAIRRCRTVCNVFQYKTEAECLNEIFEQSLKCLDFKKYGGVVRPSKDLHINPCKSPLMDLANVGDAISDRIIDEFNLSCLSDLCSIGFDDLVSVKGVTEDIADAFWVRVYGCSHKEWLEKTDFGGG